MCKAVGRDWFWDDAEGEREAASVSLVIFCFLV